MVKRLWGIALVLVVLCGLCWGISDLAIWRAKSLPWLQTRVAEGVVLGGSPVGNFTEEELLVHLKFIEGSLEQPAVQPLVDPVTKGVVPGLSGRRLNVELSLSAAISAKPHSVVELVVDEINPEPPNPGFPIFQGNPGKKQIALVVNVAWGNDELREILQVFEKHKVKSTFFLVGRWAHAFPELVQEIERHGHEFGNHAYSDPHLPQLSMAKIAEEILRTTEAIHAAVGPVPVQYFSPPYNDYNQAVLDVATDLGYLTVLCSLDTADWMRPGVDRIVRRILPRAHNGAIVLMHPTEQTPAALELIIPDLIQQGFELVPVSTLLSPSENEKR